MNANPSNHFAVPPAPTFLQRGFTLIELAIVMFIVTLLLGGMLLPLAGQQDIRNYGDTQKTLAEARDALMGYAMANGRLPCPAVDAATGVESPPGGSTSTTPCTNPNSGFFPAVTVGLAPINAQGYLLDGWGGDGANRVRYAVSTSNSNAFTTPDGMKTATMTTLGPAAAGDLEICSLGLQVRIPPVITAPDTSVKYCHPTFRLATDAVAVIYSLGKNGGVGGATDDEKHNPNPNAAALAADPVFVAAPQGVTFDDQLVWLSKSALFNRMVGAGKLP